jgi:hypothetical protein
LLWASTARPSSGCRRQGPGDLPCFVERNPMQFKGLMPGTVRMETPVADFYSPLEVLRRRSAFAFPHGS